MAELNRRLGEFERWGTQVARFLIVKLVYCVLIFPIGFSIMAAKPKKKAATETHDSIEEQTAAFLRAGGEIQQIASGVTGQQNLAGPRQIVLGKPADK